MNDILKPVFLLLSLFALELSFTQPPNSVEISLERIKEEDGMETAALSCYVVELGSGEVVAEYNKSMSLVPASVMKVVSTSAALEILGPYYRFETELQYSGEIDSNGVLHGDLYIKGGGDPTLGSRFFNADSTKRDFLYEWADSIKSYGIKAIDGKVIGDASGFGFEMTPAGWSWGDLGNYYGSSPSGLTIFDNMTYLRFNSGTKQGDSTHLACIEPYIPEFSVENYVRAANIRSDQAYVFGGPYQKERYVVGSLPLDRDNFGVKASIHDPPYQTAYEFTDALQQSGIDVSYAPTTVRRLNQSGKKSETDRKNIHTHKSPALKQIIYKVNHKSVNLFAENILRTTGKRYYGTGSNSNGTRAVERFWRKRISTQGMNVEDGSGLSRKNSLSAKNLVDVLVRMDGSKREDLFKNSLAVSGRSGTLYYVGKNTSAEGRVIGKSGSMTRVRAYTGYVSTSTDKELAFAIIANNFTCKNYMTKKYMEKLFITMSVY